MSSLRARILSPTPPWWSTAPFLLLISLVWILALAPIRQNSRLRAVQFAITLEQAPDGSWQRVKAVADAPAAVWTLRTHVSSALLWTRYSFGSDWHSAIKTEPFPSPSTPPPSQQAVALAWLSADDAGTFRSIDDANDAAIHAFRRRIVEAIARGESEIIRSRWAYHLRSTAVLVPPLLIFTALALFATRQKERSRRAAAQSRYDSIAQAIDQQRCAHCDYATTGLTLATPCPECGQSNTEQLIEAAAAIHNR